MADTMTDTVLIIDFGSQVTQLIARRVREQGVYSEIVPFNRAEDALERLKPKAIILSGGPASVHETGTPQLSPAVVDAGVPILGICYGEQTMVEQMGGGVEGGHHREFGRAELEVTGDSALFEDVWKKGEHHTVSCSPFFHTSLNRAVSPVTSNSARPNSRWCPPSTPPPICSTMVCSP